MSAAAVVDTSVLVDALVVEARNHARARARLEALDRMMLPSIVLYELVWVLKRLGTSEALVRRTLESLVGNPKVTIIQDDGRISEKAIIRLVNEGKRLSSFDDKVILESALRENTPLITYDLELKGEAKSAGIEG